MIKRKRRIEQNISGETKSSRRKVDYFSRHFSYELDGAVAERLMQSTNNASFLSQVVFKGMGPMRYEKRLEEHAINLDEEPHLENFDIPSKLLENLELANGGPLSETQLSIYNIIGRYIDMSVVTKSHEHEVLYCMHVLNHIIRTRNLVISNSHNLQELRQKGTLTEDDIERTRDQGFSRPKVLILCAMKKDAFRIVEHFRVLIFGDSSKPFISNSQRFRSEFGDTGYRINAKRDVDEEFRELMSGNVDDCFRLGIGIAKKSLKLFTPFDESDIILASPLGLRIIIGDESEITHETDFLASIEILILDKADIFLMQNWEHVLHIIDTLHSRPEKLNVDISRVRQWALNQHTSLYRQTIIFSTIQLAECEAIFALKCRNFAGFISHCPPSAGFLDCIEVPLCQELHRLPVDLAEAQSDERFAYFKEKILGKCEKGTAIFIPSYFDFVRIRNLFKVDNESFVQLNEYAKQGKVAKARELFVEGKKRFMLITERFHFFRRYRIKGIKSLVFYQVPSQPRFYHDLINMVTDMDRVLVRVIHTKFDAIRMANIFGDHTYRCIIKSTKNVLVLLSR
uniref:Digestive organ expansion factor-like protein n=3 Tax=Parascaris univalens TaxID=6257 RepID=A0A915ASK5_PARUN